MLPFILKLLGTASNSFNIGGGFLIKNNSGVAQFRNNADNAYALVEVADATTADQALNLRTGDARYAINAVKTIQFAIGHANPAYLSVSQIPNNNVVTNIIVNVVTGYSVGASIDIGVAGIGNENKFGSFALIQSAANLSAPQVTLQTPAEVIVATINGAPAAGDGTVLAFFSLPNA